VDDKEPFISRWSRRKLEATEPPGAASPAAEPSAAASAASPAPATEPGAPGAPQGSSAGYREFFDPQVDEKLRRTALRKLFSEPHFNVMDGLDTYIDDYSKPDPIPEAMLRQLNQAKELFLFDDEQEAAAGEEVQAAAADAAAASPGEGAGASALPNPAAADASAQDTVTATATGAAPPAEDSRND
jgi:hypothetical protein